MITRRILPCSRQARVLRLYGHFRDHGRVRQRRLSSTYATPATATPSSASPLASITSELDKLTPRFDVSADSIEIIPSPSDFYEVLKAKIAKARRRVYLSTLYVGKTEYELVCI